MLQLLQVSSDISLMSVPSLDGSHLEAPFHPPKRPGLPQLAAPLDLGGDGTKTPLRTAWRSLQKKMTKRLPLLTRMTRETTTGDQSRLIFSPGSHHELLDGPLLLFLLQCKDI